ncbi:jmjC domain-containing protein 8 isoform X6 [Ciconia boyciana]|uniref:jmjC domain-containing protein 8 isoform X6 n=1 Tax=Ciconia boyciana TaxID=52775 RepID=UPI003BA12FBF
MAAARRLLSLLLALAWARPAGCTDPPDGGWLAGTVPEEERCTVERADASLSYSVFLQRFAFSRPVILRGVTDNSVRVRAGAAPRSPPGGQGLPGAAGLAPALPARSGRALPGVRGAAAEAAGSGQAGQRHPLLLRGQQLHRVGPPLPAVRAPRLPHPGHQPCLQLWDRRLGLWRSLSLARPRFLRGDLRQEGEIGVSPSPGVFQRWFLYPPDKTPHFHPNETTLAWLHRTYPTLPPAERPLECTLRPGEVLYFPDRWWHATLNLDTSVFISTFLG